MANYELNAQNQILTYPSLDLFLKGGTDNGKSYPKVDMSLWDQATMCGTCHVGGPFYEKDRLGNRLPGKTLADWGPYFAGGSPSINPITSTVWQNYSTTTGKDKSFVTMSPWAYPVYLFNNGKPDPSKPNNGAMIIPAGANGTGSGGWMPMDASMPDPNGGAPYPVYAGQVMMPNVKEMDCLFCHFQGYDNVMASVMTQAGSLSAAPAVGAGLFDMTPISPTYMGYNPNTGKVSFTSVKAAGMSLPPAFASYSSHELVTLTSAVTSKILAKPSDNNCMQCHATKTLKDLPEMFGVTGNSSGFLSSAPMIYDPANGVGPLGKRMTAYDINSPFMPSGTSPVMDASVDPTFMSFMMPGLPYLQAFGATPFNSLGAGQLGGGNAAQTGPLYYYNTGANPAVPQDQNAMKRSTMPFPRAEWFKRGDAWQSGQDLHSSIGCAGCHYTGDSTNKNQCDPGRGFDMASTVQDGIPQFKDRLPVADAGLTLAETVKKHDTRNTVKRCEFCHITHQDYYGQAIEYYGAPDPTAKHQVYGLAGTGAVKVQMIDQFSLHGTFGGKGVPEHTDADTVLAMTSPSGNHLDVMDCTVCHVKKVSMAVRSLDASSGMRFPSIVGTDPMKGMLGLFEDPTGMGAEATGMGGSLKEWKPLYLWQSMGNMELPITTAGVIGQSYSGQSQMNFRRKIYLSNAITAILWNNEDGTVDANGDGAPGGLLIGDDPATGAARADGTTKPSLVGYRDIFSGDVPDENNTQGFGIPIFDPWIEHDLKAGFNFGPAPLSVISIGFGGFGTPEGITDPTGGAYASLYGADGMFNNNNWKYASVWSGAVVFTEPDQIENYKAYRTAIKSASDNKSWSGTALTLVGAPFMVTHGVKPVNQHVLGKSCADCHAPNAGFFNGGFTMTGSAIPTATDYDPGKYVQTDADGNLVLDANGDPVRYTGTAGVLPGNMMMRPLEPFRIKAKKGDLRGFVENHNKLGQPREISFVEDTADGLFSYTVPVQRADVLYPHEDGAIYYKVSDLRADGTPKAIAQGDSYDAQPMTGVAYASYLETLGKAPAAQINAIGGSDVTGNPANVTLGTGIITFAATDQANPSLTYTWTFSDLPLTDPVTGASNVKTGVSVTRTISSAKSFYANLQVKNNNTGVTATDKQYVKVTATAPTLTSVIGTIDTADGVTTVPVTVTDLHTRIYVRWGDGTEQSYMDNSTATLNLTHKYLTSGGHPATVKVLNGGTVVGIQSATITTP